LCQRNILMANNNVGADPAHLADSDPVVRTAAERFGIPYLYPFQRLVIANTLEATDQIVILPTGAGKSLCFQLPACFLPGYTLVVVPLLSLLHDHLRRLSQYDIPTGVLKGGQSQAERHRLFGGMTNGRIKLVLATPEVLLVKRVADRIKNIRLSHLVFDEAHCVSEWGNSFRPAYLEMGRLVRDLAPETATAFTATASAGIRERIRGILFGSRAPRVVMDLPDRPNIFYRVLPVLSKTGMLTRLSMNRETPLLVFSRSRTGAEQYARHLRRRLRRDDVFFYHAGLDKNERKTIEQWFLHSKSGILTATSAYGMGVDKPDIRTVIHVDVPPSVEAYLQESGRAGRDTKPSRALVLFSVRDLIFGHTLQEDYKRLRYTRLLQALRSAAVCRRRALLSLLGHTPEYCAGCDVCNGEAIPEPPEEKPLLQFFRHNNRRFNLRQVVGFLHGDAGYDGAPQGYSGYPGFGMLTTWEPEDIREAIRLLCDAKKLAIPKRGPFKHRIHFRRPPHIEI